MTAADNFFPLIKEDGSPFDSGEISALSEELGALDAAGRLEARNRNSDLIAAHEAARMLVVSGPGTGKSTLFKGRIKQWLTAYPEQQVSVATFVRKLVRDLTDDIATDPTISDEQRARIAVMTLHRLARSVIERNQGTQELRLDRHCLVITREWEEMVWEDAVSLQDEYELPDFPWATLLERLYDGEEPAEASWRALRSLHLRLEFYNALTFSDLILFGARAATENPELVADTLFIIDEFQDFNLAEEAFIRAITRESAAVLLAGDDDQVLYDQLRRAHPSIIRDYYRDTSFAKAMLPFCGRCSFHICQAADAFLAAGRPPESIEKVFLSLSDDSDCERVTVVASTSPKTGVQYIERFLEAHEETIAERRAELEAGTQKDAYLLILTPARAMNFLNVGGARDMLRELLHRFAPEDRRAGIEYWTVRDYYNLARRPTQNYALRKILSLEGVSQEVVTSLLREALDAGRNLSELDHDVIRACLRASERVRTILEGEQPLANQAQVLVELGVASDASALAADLERRPMRGEGDGDDERPQLEQNDVVAAVDLTTIVGAKGLSADHVIVLGCDEVNLERYSRNAFLVAMTRARKSLTLMACVGGGGATKLHPFVCSLPDDHTQALYVKANSTEASETIGALQERLEKWAYAKRMSPRKR